METRGNISCISRADVRRTGKRIGTSVIIYVINFGNASLGIKFLCFQNLLVWHETKIFVASSFACLSQYTKDCYGIFEIPIYDYDYHEVVRINNKVCYG